MPWRSRKLTDKKALYKSATSMLSGLLAASDELVDSVSTIATHASARDEILRASRALAGAPSEIQREDPFPINKLSVFFPSNNIIYSYILYILIPSLYSDSIAFRPSGRSLDETDRVHALLAPLSKSSVTQYAGLSQSDFLTDMAASSDVVVFTGSASNASTVRKKLFGGPIVISFGSAPMPFVIGPMADLGPALRSLVDARLYNNGQDCLGPDLVFVHQSQIHAVSNRLKIALEDEHALCHPKAEALVYNDAYEGAEEYLERHKQRIIAGGICDPEERYVAPTVVAFDSLSLFEKRELFAPIICLVEYEDVSEIFDWLEHEDQVIDGAIVSLFGEPGIATEYVGTSKVVRDNSGFDWEDGNLPFGGFGLDASCVQDSSGNIEARPLLISREAARLGSRVSLS